MWVLPNVELPKIRFFAGQSFWLVTRQGKFRVLIIDLRKFVGRL